MTQVSRLRSVVPAPLRQPARTLVRWYRRRLSPSRLNLGDLARTTPIDASWGAGRGRPIDRVYIERFLDRHQADMRGRVLEVKDDQYVRRYGRDLEQIDVLDIDPANSRATLVADLQDPSRLPEGAFDCVVLTQVLQFVYDVPAALQGVRRMLAGGGILLATVPGITRVSPHERERATEWWRFTAFSARRLAEEAFGAGNVDVETFGNVLAAAGMLYGLAAEDLSPRDLAASDVSYEVAIGIRAVKRS